MTLNTQEHIEIMACFERLYKGCFRLDRETKDLWPKGHIYQEGHLNQLFIAYRQGYALGKAIGIEAAE